MWVSYASVISCIVTHKTLDLALGIESFAFYYNRVVNTFLTIIFWALNKIA